MRRVLSTGAGIGTMCFVSSFLASAAIEMGFADSHTASGGTDDDCHAMEVACGREKKREDVSGLSVYSSGIECVAPLFFPLAQLTC